MQTDIDSIISWLRSYEKFDKVFDVSKNSEGALIDFSGTSEISKVLFKRGKSITKYVNDYILQVEKPFLTILQRKSNAEFLTDLQKWVRQQSKDNLVPLLGNHGNQKTYVDAQQFVGDDANREVATYQVMLHIEYKIFE